MPLPSVSIILNLVDGAGNPVASGSAAFTPTAQVTSSDGTLEIAPFPVTVPLGNGQFPVSVPLCPTDVTGAVPASWAWQASFTGMPGPLESFTFLVPAGPASFTAASGTPGVVTWTATSALTKLPAGTGVKLSGGSLPAGVTAGTTYYVTGGSGQTLNLAASPSGPAIAFTGSGSGTLTVASYYLSGLDPVAFSQSYSRFLMVPYGTAEAGQVPVATGAGNATAWGSPSGGSGSVASVFGRAGSVTAQSGDYSVNQVTGAAPLTSPALTGNPTAPTASSGDSSARIATTAFVAAAGTGSGAVPSVFGRTGAVTATSGDYTVSQVTGAAPLASPALTGNPTVPTQAPGDSSTRIATTAFVAAAGGSGPGAVPSVFGRTGAVTAQSGDYTAAQVTGASPVASPAFTGTPTAPTPAASDNSTKLATTAFVQGAVSGLAQGIPWKPTATVAATSALPAGTYANGTAGVGATFTVTATGTTTVDGHVLAAGDLVLLTAQATAAQNGLYTVTAAGATGVSTVLTRHPDMDQPGEFSGAVIDTGNAGTSNGGSLWICNPSGTVTVGTTAIPFIQQNSPGSVTAGTGITVSGSTVSLNVAAGAKAFASAAGDKVNAQLYGIDPTGVIAIDTIVNGLISGLPAAGGEVYLGEGIFKVSTGLLAVLGNVQSVRIRGSVGQATTLMYYGSGDCLRMYNPTTTPADISWQCEVSGLCVDGTHASAGASGIHAGDMAMLKMDVMVQNFTGTGSKGLHLDNAYTWTEESDLRGLVSNCTQLIVAEVTTGYNSFGYSDWDFTVYAGPGQDALVLKNGPYLYNSKVKVRGNVNNAVSPGAPGAALRLTGACPSGTPSAGNYSNIVATELLIQAEQDGDGGGTVAPQTIFIDTNCYIAVCTGLLDFQGTWTPSNFNITTTANPYQFSSFMGVILGDANLNPGAPCTFAGPVGYTAPAAPVISGTCYPPSNYGDFFAVTLAGNTTMALNYSGGQQAGPQRKTFVISQPASGTTNYTVTWPHTGSPALTSPTVLWAGGSAPVQSTGAGKKDMYELSTLDGVTWIGRATQNVS